jgi:hypothetical protein
MELSGAYLKPPFLCLDANRRSSSPRTHVLHARKRTDIVLLTKVCYGSLVKIRVLKDTLNNNMENKEARYALFTCMLFGLVRCFTDGSNLNDTRIDQVQKMGYFSIYI